LGTTPASLGALPGDQLFAGVLDQPAGTPVTVSGDWSLGPLPGGQYEVRAFYDLHGQFDPAFSISKLPHQGDIAGGAIDDVPGLLMQATALEQMNLTPLIGTNIHPNYRAIDVGTQPSTGPCKADTDCGALGAGYSCQGGYCVPPQGVNVEGVAVSLGL